MYAGEAESGDVGDMRLRVLACRENLPVGPRLSAGALPQCRNELKELLSPNLCPSCASSLTPLPPACACVYSSPSRRTPADAGARTPRTGYCGRRRRSDRPFRTGLQRWLEEGHVLSQAPVFHEFLESIYFNFKVLIWTESSILAQDERWRRA